MIPILLLVTATFRPPAPTVGDLITIDFRQSVVLDRSPQYEIRFLLGSGDLMMMDNRRLLHGRTAFDPREGLRHLQGCYIDIDGPRSVYRVLRRRLRSSGRQV